MNLPRPVKLAIVVGILAATAAAFVFYAAAHPEIITNLKAVKPATLAALLLAYAMGFVALALVLHISLRMYGKTIPYRESILLNAYSSLVNFFGPGHSGVAVRGVYLKKRHDFKFRNYMFTTLLYYAFYAVISAFLLFVGSQPWWQTILLVFAVASVSYIVIKRYARKSYATAGAGMTPVNLVLLFGATALQVTALSLIYYIELTAADPSVSIGQALAYTGAANFALFVALTPGAIGIREAFLIFSQNLHHITNGAIVTANVLDRAVYLLFLGMLFLVVLVTHASHKFRSPMMTEADK